MSWPEWGTQVGHTGSLLNTLGIILISGPVAPSQREVDDPAVRRSEFGSCLVLCNEECQRLQGRGFRPGTEARLVPAPARCGSHQARLLLELLVLTPSLQTAPALPAAAPASRGRSCRPPPSPGRAARTPVLAVSSEASPWGRLWLPRQMGVLLPLHLECPLLVIVALYPPTLFLKTISSGE